MYCSSEYAGERIATLEEAVSLCEELDLLLFLDVKPFKTEEVGFVLYMAALCASN